MTTPITIRFPRDKPTVFFSLTAPTRKEGAVYLVPDNGDWNDFGYFTTFKIVIVGPQGILRFTLAERTKVLFRDATNSHKLISDLIARNPSDPLPVSDVRGKFISQMQDEAGYRRLAKVCDVDAARYILTEINDAGFLKDAWPEGFPADLLNSEGWTLSLLREQAAFVAFEDGFTPELSDTPDTESASLMRLVFKVSADSDPQNLTMNFGGDSLADNNIALLIGKNGTGKTTALVELIRALFDQGQEKSPTDRKVPDILPRPAISRLTAFYWFADDPFPDREPLNSLFKYSAIPLSRQGLTREITRWLRRIARRQTSLTNEAVTIPYLYDLLGPLLPIDRLHVPLREGKFDGANVVDHDGARYARFRQPPGGEQRRLEFLGAIDDKAPVFLDAQLREIKLSSGQQLFLKFALGAAANIAPRSLMILDEPETHLHPNLISDFVKLLKSLLSQTRSRAVIGTHSVYLAREVPRTAVRVFRRVDNQLSIQTPIAETFGASLDLLSDYVFDDQETTKQFEEAIRDRVNEENGVQGVLDRYRDQLSPDLMMILSKVRRRE